MELRPPRWFAPLLGLVSAVFAALALVVVSAAGRGPVGLWVLGAGVAAVGGVAGAISAIGTRAVVVRGGTVRVSGVRPHDFLGDELVPELAPGLFGVRLADGRTSRRVFAQLPHQSADLVLRLPQHFPQLQPTPAFPVVLPGRISTPVAYGIGAVLVAGLGGWATYSGVVGPPADGPDRAVLLVVGTPMLVLGAVTVAWSVRRAERRVEVHADHVVHVHLVGRRTRPLGQFAAATVVRSARALPRSTLEREVHHLRRTDVGGATVELAPMLAAFPEYGAAEGPLMDGRARQLHRLHGVPLRPVELVRSRRGMVALWDHGEASPGAHRHTLVLPRPVGGRRAVALLHGRVAVGGSVADCVASYDDRLLLLLDLEHGQVRHVVVGSPIRSLDPGLRRIVTGDGPVDLGALAASAVSGWPRTWGPLGVPNTPWMPALELTLERLELLGGERAAVESLLLVRAHEALLDVLAGSADAPALLESAGELARLDAV